LCFVANVAQPHCPVLGMLRLARGALVTLVLACHQCQALIAQESGASRLRQSPTGAGCRLATNAAAVEAMEATFTTHLEKHVPEDISSQHAVVLTPRDPFAGGGFTMEAFLALPRLRDDADRYTTAYTKFVIVANSRQPGPTAVSLGIDVCDNATGFTDDLAVKFLHKEVFRRMHSFAPKVHHCGPSEPCPDRVPPALEQYLPVLAALLGRDRSLEGSLLPIVMQGQDLVQASRLGDALAYLIQAGGIWEAERVLFIFVGDLSTRLLPAQERLCNDHTAEVVMQRGVPQVAEYFHALLTGGARAGCPPATLPQDYGPILSAVRVAALAKLIERRAVTDRTGGHYDARAAAEGRPQPVVGLLSGLFWSDDRTAWERSGAHAAQDKHMQRAKQSAVR